MLPIKLAFETLCTEKVNLYVAILTLKFMLDKLSKKNTFFSIALKKELICCIKGRRMIFSDVLHYLTDPNLVFSVKGNYGIFNISSKATNIKSIVDIVESILYNNVESGDSSQRH